MYQRVRERERERWRQREREREREAEVDEGSDRWKWIFFLLVRLHHAAYSDHDNTIDRHVYHSCTCSIHFFLFVFPISWSKLHSPITKYNISLFFSFPFSLSFALFFSFSFHIFPSLTSTHFTVTPVICHSSVLQFLHAKCHHSNQFDVY